MNTVDNLELNGTNALEPKTVIDPTEVEPTPEELTTLPHIVDRIPLAAWLIVFCELCERSAFYGLSGPFQNYIQFPVPDPGDAQPGALGRGQQTATLLTTFFIFFCSLTPIAGAIVSDQFWGKFKTSLAACVVYLLGLLVLVLTSIPQAIRAGVGLPGLIVAMIILGIASGTVQSNICPLMAEQYTRKTPVVKEIKGKKKIIDPEITVQSLFNWFYWAINLGALSSILTTNVEKYHSFWLAYLITLIFFAGSIIVLIVTRRQYTRIPPTGSLILRACRAIFTAIKIRWKSGKQENKDNLLDYAKDAEPSSEDVGKETRTKLSNNQFIDDLRQTIRACRVFAFFPFYWICYNQLGGNLTSQAAQMNVGPLPNDILQNIDPIVLVIFIPIFDKLIYPGLRRCNINFPPITRITCGFICMSIAMAWSALVQHWIYITGPNFAYTNESCSTCQKFNNITVAWQIPSYFLIAISEIFASITGLEYAYTQAPSTMKAIVMSVFLFTSAIGSALNFALLPVVVDPKLMWMYASLSIEVFVAGIVFFIVLRKDNKVHEKPT